MKRYVLLVISVAAMGLLTACANQQVTAYKNDPHDFLKELVYCQNNYAAIGNTPKCQAAFKVNSELFPE
jgi:hypothetical protein